MRRRFLVEVGPGKTWPENPGVSGGSGTSAVDSFSWIRWDSRGLADVVLSIDGAIEAPGGTPNPRQYFDYIPAGETNVRNIGKPAATELHFFNVDATNNALLWIELDTEPIVDLGNTRILLDRSKKGIQTANPLAIEVVDGSGSGRVAGVQVAGVDGFSSVTQLATFAQIAAFGGAGVNFVSPRVATTFKKIQALAVTAGTPQSVWTPAASRKFRLMGWFLSLSVAGKILFEDTTGGANEIIRTPAMAAGVGVASPPIGNGILSAAANNQLFIDVSATGTVDGFVFGTEE